MTHFLADDGEKIHVGISGHGSPLILLHGWTSSRQEWFPFLAELNARHRVYRWDARGHGGHPLAHAGSATAERMARDLRNLIAHFGLHNATAVGHSMGALTLWQYLRDHGTHGLGKLCFIDQSPKLLTDDDWAHGIYGDFGVDRNNELISWLRDDFAEGVLKLTAHGLNQRAAEKYRQNASGWQRSRAALRAQNPEPLINCWQSLTAADYRDVLAKIPLPTLLIYGGESNFYRSSTAHYVADHIPERRAAHLRGHRPLAAPVAARALRRRVDGLHQPAGLRRDQVVRNFWTACSRRCFSARTLLA